MADETKITLQAPDGVTGQFHAQSSAVYQVVEGKVAVALKDVGDFLRLGFTHVVEKIEAAVEQVVEAVEGGAKDDVGAIVNDAVDQAKADESTAETVATEAKAEVQATETAAVEKVESVAEPAAQAGADEAQSGTN